jgi:hypothetical protein
MNLCQTIASNEATQGSFRWSQLDTAQAFADFSDPFDPPISQRQYAQEHAIPRSTLGDWLRRPDPPGVAKEVLLFFRSPAGLTFLRRLILALLLICHHQHGVGIRPLCEFLRLVELDHFVGSSYGSLQWLASQVQAQLIALGKEEGQRLADLMTARCIALVPDEHFHAGCPCLIAMEPVSGFILVETYAHNRDSSTWAGVITQATKDLPVTVVALTSDRAKALIATSEILGTQYTPEIFHGMRDLSRPLFAAMERRIAPMEKELETATWVLKYWQHHQQHASTKTPAPGQPTVAFDRLIQQATIRLGNAKEKLESQQKEQQRAHDALLGLADDYHVFDAKTGQPVKALEMQTRLQERHKTLSSVASQNNLGKASEEALLKGKEWLTALVATVAWFWEMTQQRVEEMSLPQEAEKEMYEKLLPGLYWEQTARQGRTAEQRQDRRELGQRLVEEAWGVGSPLRALTVEQQQQVQRLAKEIVGLFCRSSSCVEGRNGRLSLHQHGHTRLGAKQLKAQTVVHNYIAQRADGSTAAERFFGVKQRDAFAWLLERLPELPRPAPRRPSPAQKAASAPA